MKILEQSKRLIPKKYYTYKTGTVGSSYIAEDGAKGYNATLKTDPKESVVVNIVDLVLNQTAERLGMPRDNKTAVMCEIDMGGGRKLEVYFASYNNTRAICTEIRPEGPAIEVPLTKRK